MKTKTSISSSLLLVLLLSISSFSFCGKIQAQNSIALGVKAMQSTLPLKVNDDSKITRVEYKNNVLTYVMQVSDNLFAVLKKMDVSTIKDGAMMGLEQTWKSMNMMDDVMKYVDALDYFIQDTKGNNSIKIHMTSFELRDLAKKVKNGTVQSPLSVMQSQVASLKAKLPMTVANGVEIIDVRMDGRIVVYTCKINTTGDKVNQDVIASVRKNHVKSLSQSYQTLKLKEEQISFKYIYLNANGKTLFQININSYDFQ